jgi:hypothetical protein
MKTAVAVDAQPPAILTLPTELLILISSYLEPYQKDTLPLRSSWKYLQAVMLTCKVFYHSLHVKMFETVSVTACLDPSHDWPGFVNFLVKGLCTPQIARLEIKKCALHEDGLPASEFLAFQHCLPELIRVRELRFAYPLA